MAYMAKKTQQQYLPRSTAEDLAIREAGLARCNLRRMERSCYMGHQGCLRIEIYPEEVALKPMIHMEIKAAMGQTIDLFFNPETLEEDFRAEETYKKWLEGTKNE